MNKKQMSSSPSTATLHASTPTPRSNRASFFSLTTLLLMLISFSGCSKQKPKEDMNFKELRDKAATLIEAKRRDLAVEYLEQIIARHHDREDISKYKLLLAELYYKAENYEAAQELYNHYQQFYPSDKQVEYAHYRSILSQFNQTLQSDCDQAPTKKTIELCANYLKNPLLSEHSQDIADIKKTCEYKLINKEIYVFDFYLKRKKYEAAEKRLKYIATHFLPEHEELASRLLYLECKLADRMKDKERLKDRLTTLSTSFPDSQYTRMTYSMLEKKRFILL